MTNAFDQMFLIYFHLLGVQNKLYIANKDSLLVTKNVAYYQKVRMNSYFIST